MKQNALLHLTKADSRTFLVTLSSNILNNILFFEKVN